MRLYDWEARLAQYVARVAREGFLLGRHDCALFAAGGVEAVTGTDPAASWRGAYDTLAGGVRLIRAAGFDDHIAAAEALHPAVEFGAEPCDEPFESGRVVAADDDADVGEPGDRVEAVRAGVDGVHVHLAGRERRRDGCREGRQHRAAAGT